MLKLTQTVQKGGCAAKVAAVELRKILKNVKFPPRDPRVSVDGGLFDDAAIFDISHDLAMVQTLDFFTPIVDTPTTFGKIAAANSLSDVYAMGGEPKTAMAILAFPLATLSSEVASQVLQGACDVMAQAETSLVGGHSIDDDTLKFGLSVTGFVHPRQVWSNAQARPKDKLILTKGLGTGTLTAGLKRLAWDEEAMDEAIQSMAQINRVRDLLGPLTDAIRAATDVTGFGLAGHAMQMAQASKATLTFDFEQLPILTGALDSLKEGFLTKAHRTNREYTESQGNLRPLSDVQRQILFDPQTSGGLLLSVDPERAQSILEALKTRFAKAQIVGEVGVQSDAAWVVQ